jgi:aarF domain-containing kinase
MNKVVFFMLMQVLQLCRKHEVTIDSSYASLVVAVCVLVGFARSLDPELSIMDAAIPCLFFYNLVGRIPGGIYG